MNFHTLHKAARILALIIVALVSLPSGQDPAFAQESRERGTLVGTAAGGPYELTMRGLPQRPKVGTFNFTITVRSMATGELVKGAEVTVVAIDPEGERDWLSPALPFPTDATSYVGNGEFESAGGWTMEVQVEGSEGEALVQFPLEIQELARGGGVSAGIVFALAMLAILLGVSWLIFRARRAQRRSASRAQTP